jgi:hypothetical protein
VETIFSIGEGGRERSDEFVISAPPFLCFRRSAALAVSEPPAALPDGDHYREMAGRLRELAHLTRSPGIRRELVDRAKRYDRRGDHFDCRSR